MRRFHTLLCLLLICVCAYSQHLSFRGIEIDGNIKNFVQKLGGIGFNPSIATGLIDKPGTINAITGIFCGEEVSLEVIYNTRNKLTTRVIVSADFETESEVIQYINKATGYVTQCYDFARSHPTKDVYGDYFDNIFCYNKFNGKAVYCGTIIIRYKYFESTDADRNRYIVLIEFYDSNADKK